MAVEAEQLEFLPIFYWAALSSLTPQQVASACVPWRAVPKETQVQALQLHMEDTSAPSDSVLRTVEALWDKDPPEALLLERLLQAWIYNSFDLSEDGKQAGVIFFASAMMSHSCAPNAAWHLDENNSFILHARCFIEAGEEVTISYLSPEELMLPTLHRRKLLQSTKGFTCGCCRCVEVLDPARAFKCGDCGTEALARAQPDADKDELVCQSCGQRGERGEPGDGWALRALQLEAKLTPWARSRPWFSTLAKVQDEVDDAPEASLAEGEGVLSDRHWIMDALLAAQEYLNPQLAIEVLQRRLRVHQEDYCMTLRARLQVSLAKALCRDGQHGAAREACAEAAKFFAILFGDDHPEHLEPNPWDPMV